MALEKNFAKPEHPLPKEIQEMKRDETICQFCGVSYLIHNEIKKLEDEIIQLKNELERCKGFDERERELKIKLEDESRKLQKVEKDLNQEKERNDSLAEELSEINMQKSKVEADRDALRSNLQEHVDQITEMKNKNQNLSSSLGYFQETTMSLKDDLVYCVTGMNKQREEMREYVTKMENIIFLVSNKHANEKTKIIMDNDQLKAKLDISQRSLQEVESKIDDMKIQARACKDLEAGLELRLKEIDALKIESKKVKTENDALAVAVQKLKAVLSEKSNKLMETQSSLQTAEESLRNVESREVKLQESWKIEKESFSGKIKSLETEIKNLKSSQKEETEAVATSSIQIKVLKECLDKSKNEVSLLKKEREDMIDAHQNRIKELRESFHQKMLEADAWPKKLEEKLEEQQRKLNEEKNKLWKELTTSFQKEMENINEAHTKEKHDIEEREKSHTVKIREQLETLQRRSKEELDSCRSKMSREKDKHDKITRSQEALIQNLESKIADMEARLTGLQQKTAEEEISYKQRYMDTKRALEYLKEDFKRIEKELVGSKQEVDVLQETVRRECEERFELTEALSEARMQLLSSQRRPSLAKLNSKMLVPSPPSTTSSDRNVMKEKLLRNKRMESMEERLASTRCSVSQESGITYDKVSKHEDDARKRIAEAVAKQRASSRASFDKFRD